MQPTVVTVAPLLKALIVEAAGLSGETDVDGYRRRVVALILDQLRRASHLKAALPRPQSPALLPLCEALFLEPADQRGADAWSSKLGRSSRTLARRFEAEIGMPPRSWRRRLRVFRAIKLFEWWVTRYGCDDGPRLQLSLGIHLRVSRRDGIEPHALTRGK